MWKIKLFEFWIFRDVQVLMARKIFIRLNTKYYLSKRRKTSFFLWWRIRLRASLGLGHLARGENGPIRSWTKFWPEKTGRDWANRGARGIIAIYWTNDSFKGFKEALGERSRGQNRHPFMAESRGQNRHTSREDKTASQVKRIKTANCQKEPFLKILL